MGKLIIYYSYSGNTKNVASIIRDYFNCDILEIETKEPYDGDYNEVIQRAEDDIDKNFQPKLKEIPINFDDYDTIILGCPVWWYTFASPMNTFLNSYNLKDKVIIPFVTNGGFIGHTIEDISKFSKHVINPISLKFDGNELLDKEKLANWLVSIK